MLNASYPLGVRSMSTAQYDTLDDAAVAQLAHCALQRYPFLRDGELQLICRSENATFCVQARGQRYALRLHRGHYHRKVAIESELLWLDALREEGISVPEALYDGEGERVQTLSLPGGEQRHAVIFHWVAGEMPTHGIDPRAFEPLGQITARLHRHSQCWQKPAGFTRIRWDHASMIGAEGHWGHWCEAPGLRPSDRALMDEAVARIGVEMAAFGTSPARYGLIHADLRLTNLLLHQGETRVIDFDDCGMGWYLHDLAAAISFEEHHPNAPAWIEHWLTGYEREAHLDDDDLAVIPALVMQRRIQMTAWVASHAQTQMAQSLGSDWMHHTVRLCRRYLEEQVLPVGS
ncbi:phosphotransferase enzyme family protein [Zymobacter palmae]|uniref:Putative homoserine kinasetype II n=1 Tax=Zymobacter palmae TaxID=33074 RepID=A0A348HCP9_9GAMM|nr:phosphotransferase [Zymobacter palmae]BBG29401.1 putative homoserine kinasetype II [Zymobacter palmae]